MIIHPPASAPPQPQPQSGRRGRIQRTPIVWDNPAARGGRGASAMGQAGGRGAFAAPGGGGAPVPRGGGTAFRSGVRGSNRARRARGGRGRGGAAPGGGGMMPQ